MNIRPADQYNNIIEQEIVEKESISQVEQDKETDPTPIINNGDGLYKLAVAEVLDTDYKGKNKEDIDIIHDYAMAQIKGNADQMTVKWAVRELVDSIGTGALGEDRIARIARYAYLSMESKRNEAERRSLLK